MKMNVYNNLLRYILPILGSITLLMVMGCAGTIHTISYTNKQEVKFKKAYIVTPENSEYIKFRMGIIVPFAYIQLPDNPAEKHPVIGNTDQVIKRELEKQGIPAVIGKRGDHPENADLFVYYLDTWRWDFKKILDRLEIVFVSPEDKQVIAESVYTIYQNKELHNFPTPEKEVPKMIKELLKETTGQ